MGMSTPNFFNSAWNPEQGDFPFADNPTENYGTYGQTYPVGNGESDPFDYFSGRPGHQFANNQGYQTGFDASSDDIGRILTPGLSFLNMDLDPEMDKPLAAPTSYPSLNQEPPTNGLLSYRAALVFGQDGLEAVPGDQWTSTMKPQNLHTATLEKDTDGSTVLKHGQVTPGDSPQDEDKNGGQANSTAFQGSESQVKATRSSNGKRSSVASKVEESPTSFQTAPKPAKKARKSKKKPITKEQEEAKRKRFLERNRVAADKCRQNRKKWIDDLQEKCHIFSTDNALKKAALEEMEQELLQMKNMLLLHSQHCKDPNILAWVNQESQKPAAIPRTDQFADSPESQQYSSRGSTPFKVEASAQSSPT